MSRRGYRVATRYIRALSKTAAYYELEPGTSVDEVLRRWAEDGDKAYDHSMPVWYSPRDLRRYKEYNWTRENSRPGNAIVNGKRVHLQGPLKWDAIAEDLRIRGWDIKEPLHMQVGRNGKAMVGEGNHRLAIAEQLGLSKVPVLFHFRQKVEKEKPIEEPTVSPRAVKRVVEKVKKVKERKPLDPETEKQVDELMELLGF